MSIRRGLIRALAACLLLGCGAAIYVVLTRPGMSYVPLQIFGLLFLFLAVATALLPPLLRPISIIGSSLAFGLTVVEGFAIWRAPKPPLYASFETPGLQVSAPVVGWDNGTAGVYRVHQVDPETGAVIFDARYTLDDNHDRLTRSTETGPSVVFWGASFTFGHGVNDADTLPQRFADLLGGTQRTLNFGVGGHSPAQVLREMQTGYKDKVIGTPSAFVMLTGAFHSVRSACREDWTDSAPRFEKRDGRLVYMGACREGLALKLRSFLRQSASFQQLIQPHIPRETREGIDLYIDIVAEIAALAQSKYGVELLVPYVGGPVESPQSLHDAQAAVVPTLAYFPGTGYDDASVIAALRKRGVHVVDMTLREDAMAGHVIAIPGDRHPTPYANARRAALVLKELEAMGVALRHAETQSGEMTSPAK